MAWHRTRYYPLAVRVLTGVLTAVAVLILVYLVLILLEANPANPLVDFIAAIAKVQALINYGLAALAYLLLGALVHSVGRRTVD
jgi:hypothetical protein